MRIDPEVTEPEREPLYFFINIEDVQPEVADMVQNIKRVAESNLYRWRTFPIHLPPAVAIVTEGETPGRKKTINMRDLFVAPSFDELSAVAMDNTGEPKKLTEKQLKNIKERGEFEVDSIHFPGQVHKWRLSQLLQKGTFRAHESILNDTALALRLIIITAKNRIYSHFFSLSQSIVGLCSGLLKLLDVVIGVPSLKAKDLFTKIREERRKYLVAELVVKQSLEEELDNLCIFVKQQIRKSAVEKYDLENERLPPIPYLYETPKGTEIDLRLFNKHIMKKALPVLAGILDKEAKGWFIQFKEKCIADLKGRGLSEDDIERQANQAIMDEYMRRVYNSVLSHPEILELGPGIGKLLVEQAQAVLLIHRAVDNVQDKLAHSQEQWKNHLQRNHPILSRIDPWMRDQIASSEVCQPALEKFCSESLWAAHEEALILCRENLLSQATYFLQRDLTFMKEREPILLQELSNVKNPTRVFYWHTQIWCPSNWIVRRIFQGQSEVIPTVISEVPTSITSPRSDPNEPVYLVEKQVTRTSSTRWPFWRWVNYCQRTWAWTWNAMFFFGVVIPWCSPVSLRALASPTPFMPDIELSQVNGTLCPRKSSLTHTLLSRLLALWRHISKSRTEFESRPDTGFIGKSLTRFLNRVWNYVVKGAVGTLGIVMVFPALCLVVSGSSLFIALTTPVWMPVATLLLHLFGVLVYDWDCPDQSANKWFIILEAVFWKILVLGALQPILAVSAGFIFCPLGAFFVMIVALVRRGSRSLWDSFMFHMIIKKRGRIPGSDSFIARRIAGPGLASNYYYQVRAEQALAAFETKLEIEELNAYKDEMERIIARPQQEFSDFVVKCFQPFSATLSKEGVYKALEKEAKDLSAAVREKVDKRKTELQTNMNISIRSRIKLSSRDLKNTLRLAAMMLEKFYPTHVLKRLPISEEDFWESKGLAFRDWPGFAGLLFSEIFSMDFLTPLEETDTTFRLEVQHLNLSKYVEMLRSTEYRDDLDLVTAVHSPKGNIKVHSPYLDVNNFNPVDKNGASAHTEERTRKQYPWKRRKTHYMTEKLQIPVPIPHPSNIAVIIYNRESEDPIPLENELCQRILQAAEDAYHPDSEYINVELTPLDGRSINSRADESMTFEHDPDALERVETISESGSHSTDVDKPIRVNLASTEDIVLEAEKERVAYSSYTTTV